MLLVVEVVLLVRIVAFRSLCFVFVVVVNIMSLGVYLVVIDTVDLDPAVSSRSLVSFEAFLFLLLLVNLCLRQLRFGLGLMNLVATITTIALRSVTIAATMAAKSTTSITVRTEESTAPAAAPARTAPFSGFSGRDSKDCESRKNFHDTYIICISLGDSKLRIYA